MLIGQSLCFSLSQQNINHWKCFQLLIKKLYVGYISTKLITHLMKSAVKITYPITHYIPCKACPLTHLPLNQSIKSSFVKGAGAHPQNAPCRRRSHALRSPPVWWGRLLIYRGGQNIVSHRPQINHTLVLLHSLIPSLLRPSRTLPHRDWPGPHPIYLTTGTHDMPKPPKPTLPNQNGKVAYP